MSDLTPRAKQVLALARKEAERFNHSYVGTEHLLLGLIKLGQGVAVNVLERMGLDLDRVRMEVERLVGSHPKTNMIGDTPYTPRVKKVLALAGKEAKALNHSHVGTEHILLGLLREGEGIAARVLKNLDVDLAQTRDEILKELDPTSTPPESEAEAQQESDKKEVKRSALLAFGRDLTELAKKGELDPVIGRNNEIERVIQILCRRTKNNPVLLGRAGVGKTAIVEGLAQEIADGKMPELLRDKRIVTFDLALMVAGTKYRGQFEERIQLDKSAVEFLIDKGYDPIYGARPMRRAVEKFLENPLAEELLRENIQQGDTLEVRAASEQLALKVTVGGAT
jgi:ATP-dependent Clp protease ATP-binding subunit ClpC